MPSVKKRQASINTTPRKTVPTRRSSRILLRKIESFRKRSRINDRRLKVSNLFVKTGQEPLKHQNKRATMTGNTMSSQKRVLPTRNESRWPTPSKNLSCTCYNPPHCPVHHVYPKQSMIATSGLSVTFDNAQLSLTAGHQWTDKPNMSNECHEKSFSTSSNEPITLPAIFQGQLIIRQPYANSLNQMVTSQINNYPFASLNKRNVVLSDDKMLQCTSTATSRCNVKNNNNSSSFDCDEEIHPDEPTPPSCKRENQYSPDENRRKPLVKSDCKPPKSNWSPVGKPVKRWVYLRNDERPVRRLCFNSIKHNVEKDVIRLRDCVIINSDDTGSVYVGKVAEFFEDPIDKILRVSLVWYYSPQQTAMGRQHWQRNNELLASRHLDVIPADCIEDLVFVLTLNEYNRYCAENLNDTLWPRRSETVPRAFKRYHRRRFMPTEDAAEDTVFFCRQFYDFTGKSALRDPT